MRKLRLDHPSKFLLSPLLVMLALACTRASAQTTFYLTSSGGDDTAAINGLIGSAAAGDTVFLNAGNFQISSSIQAKTGVRIVGAGTGLTTVSNIGGSLAMIELHSKSNVEVANLTLNGNGNATHGIWATNGSGHFLHHSSIQNIAADGHGVHFSTNVTDSRILNNQVSNIGVGSDWGAGIRVSWGSSRNEISNNQISQTGRGGIFANDGSTDLVIKNNSVTGSGNTITDKLGIEVWHNCHRALIENNTIDKWLSVDRSNLVAVRNNVVNGGFIGLELAGGQDNLYVGNTVNAGSQLGISVSSSAAVKERVLWSHNTIDGALSWAAQIQPDMPGGVKQLYFYGNQFIDTTYDPLNSVYPGGDGFRFNLNTSSIEDIQNITLDSNLISGNQWTGLLGGEWTDKLSVINNTISNNGGLAVSMNSSSPMFGDNLRWEGNTVTGNLSNAQPDSKGSFFDPQNLPTINLLISGLFYVGNPISFSFDYAGVDARSHALWDFGTGLPVTAFDTNYTYEQAGNYRVGLVVWDTSGRGAYREQWITITAVPEPSSMLLVLAVCGPALMRRGRHAR